MNMNKTLIAAAIAAATMSGSAMAAWTTGSIDTVANEITDTIQPAGAAVIYTLTGGMAQNDIITVTLTGGATFSAEPTLTPSAGDLGGGVTTAATPITSAIGLSTATWRVVSATIAAAATFTLNSNVANGYELSAVAANGSVDIQMSAATSGGTPLFSNASVATDANAAAAPVFQFQPALATTVTAGTDQAKAVGIYKFFDAAGTDVTSSALVVSLTNTADTLPNAAIALGKILVTISGDFSGVTTLTGTGITGSTSAGDASVVAGTTKGTAGSFFIDAAAGKAYAVSSATVASAATLAIAPVVTIDGTTSQSARGFSVEAQIITGETNLDAGSVLATTDVYSITRDGTFFTTNSTGGLNTLKITDQSGVIPAGGAAITVTAYDVSGVVVAAAAGAPALTASVENNSTITISGADLAANYPTGVRFDVVIDSNDANVSNVKKTSSGTTVTTFRSGANGSL